jgi:Tol biopolymer transport system component
MVPPPIAHYKITSKLGEGGMGEVYRATDTKLGRDVAIKVIPDAFAQDADRMARFGREAQVLASLNHPNIAAIYGAEERALVLELVEGPTLAESTAQGPMPVEEALPIARQIAEAMEYAHERGIIHRDLKPANIKLTPEGRVKVLDFGLAKLTEQRQQPATALTQTMAITGTPGYLAPEQLEGKPADARSDIFAFGCVLYELLSGQRAFPGKSLAAALTATAMTEPKAIEGAPKELERLVRRCLRKDPARRIQHMDDVRVALEDLAEDSEPGGVSGAEAPPAALRPWLGWSVAAALAACLAALAFVHFREKPPAPPEVTRFQIRLPDKVRFTAGGTFTFSPDGRHVAFAAIGADQPPRIWVQDMDALEARPLLATLTGPNPPPVFWSPDSRYVAFSENSPKLAKVDVTSGTVHSVCDKPGAPIGGSWNRGDVIIFGSMSTGLWRVPAAGGKPVPLTTLDASRNERQHELPSFLPDGKHFLYLRVSREPDESGIYIGSLDDPPDRQSKKRLLATGLGATLAPSGDGQTGSLLFLRDGTLMAQPFDPARQELSGSPSAIAEQVGSAYETGYFSASPRALVYRATLAPRESQFTWFDRQGKASEKVGDPGQIGNTYRLSPDGTRVAFAQAKSEDLEEVDLWLLDLARGTSTRFTFGNRTASISPVWSPDSAEIAFASNRDGVYNLYRKPANGSKEEEVLLKTNGNKRPLDWSRDGRFLLYATSDSSNFIIEHIWVLPMQGDRTPFPFQNTPFDESRARFSPDGHWVAYDSAESGRHEVYVREFQPGAGSAGGGGKWMVSKDGGMAPQWRGDGKELIYRGLERQVMSVDVDTSRLFQAGAPRELFRLPAGAGLLPTSDFKRFLSPIPLEQNVPPSFTVMLNWTSAIKSR